MHHKLGITIRSVDGYSSEVSCEIGLWWSPRQKNEVSSFPFCLPQYFSFFLVILCLTHCSVTANTFSLLQFKLRCVISIVMYNSFIWDHLANCWGSQQMHLTHPICSWAGMTWPASGIGKHVAWQILNWIINWGYGSCYRYSTLISSLVHTKYWSTGFLLKRNWMKALLSLNIHCVSPRHLAQESMVSSFKFSISKNALFMEMQGMHV
jgi:hypothetical protein